MLRSEFSFDHRFTAWGWGTGRFKGDYSAVRRKNHYCEPSGARRLRRAQGFRAAIRWWNYLAIRQVSPPLGTRRLLKIFGLLTGHDLPFCFEPIIKIVPMPRPRC